VFFPKLLPPPHHIFCTIWHQQPISVPSFRVFGPAPIASLATFSQLPTRYQSARGFCPPPRPWVVFGVLRATNRKLKPQTGRVFWLVPPSFFFFGFWGVKGQVHKACSISMHHKVYQPQGVPIPVHCYCQGFFRLTLPWVPNPIGRLCPVSLFSNVQTASPATQYFFLPCVVHGFVF